MKEQKFKIYCDKHRHKYWIVRIFPDKKSMFRWNIKDGYCPPNKKHDYLGVTRAYSVYYFDKGKKKSGRKSGEVGCISFVVAHCTSGIVSHECTHAALYWFLDTYKKVEKLLIPEYDEKFAWVQGNLVRQIWVHWFRLEKKGIIAIK